MLSAPPLLKIVQWVAILEAGTPDNPTVFAAPADHRTAPPLSYTELLEEAPFIVSPKTATSPPASGGFSSHGGGSSERRFGRGGGASTESRHCTARQKTYVLRINTSLLFVLFEEFISIHRMVLPAMPITQLQLKRVLPEATLLFKGKSSTVEICGARHVFDPFK